MTIWQVFAYLVIWHYICVNITHINPKTQNTMKVFHLKFNKESDGCWYIDFPGYPFDHHNLMMVAGANLLCQYVAGKEGHPDYAVVDVTTGDHLIGGKTPDIIMTRFKKGYGASYHNATPDGLPPRINEEGRDIEVPEAWICPVTLLVLGRYPKQINLYLKDE